MRKFTIVYLILLGTSVLYLGEGNYIFFLGFVDLFVAYVIYKILR